MIAPLNNSVNDKDLWGEHNVTLNTITRIMLFEITKNVGSVSDFHNKEGEGRDP
tara:strand:+ start:57 stop:218 length:162 start_codon:yes stop_codon:yes gene_type:complete